MNLEWVRRQLFGAPAGYPRSRWRPRRLLATQSLLIGLFAVGLCLSGAGPADPLWIEGIYDGADGDNIAELPTGARITSERTVRSPLHALRAGARGFSDPPHAAIYTSAPQLRSPPAV
jgi:hypothetical protein